MVVPPERFRDEELFDTRAALQAGGHHVVVASTHVGRCPGSRGGHVCAEVPLDAQRAADYEAIVFVGGGGSKLLWRDEDALRLAREAADGNKVLGAICLAPVILGNAGVLRGRKATVAGTEARTIEMAGAAYTGPRSHGRWERRHRERAKERDAVRAATCGTAGVSLPVAGRTRASARSPAGGPASGPLRCRLLRRGTLKRTRTIRGRDDGFGAQTQRAE